MTTSNTTIMIIIVEVFDPFSWSESSAVFWEFIWEVPDDDSSEYELDKSLLVSDEIKVDSSSDDSDVCEEEDSIVESSSSDDSVNCEEESGVEKDGEMEGESDEISEDGDGNGSVDVWVGKGLLVGGLVGATQKAVFKKYISLINEFSGVILFVFKLSGLLQISWSFEILQLIRVKVP